MSEIGLPVKPTQASTCSQLAYLPRRKDPNIVYVWTHVGCSHSSNPLGKSEWPCALGHLWLYFHFLLLFQVYASVPFSLVAPGESFATDVAGKRLLPGMSPGVGGKVIATAETAQTDAALERFMACVDADVPVELIRAREAPVAALHGAGEGFLFGWAVRGGGALSGPGGLRWTGGVTLGKRIWQQGRIQDGVYGAR